LKILAGQAGRQRAGTALLAMRWKARVAGITAKSNIRVIHMTGFTPAVILLIVAAVIVMVVGHITKKRDAGIGIGLLLLVIAGLSYMNVLSFGEQPGIGLPGLEDKGMVLPISKLTLRVQEAGSDAWNTADGTVNFYQAGVDPSDPTANTIDTATLTDGNAVTENGVLKTGTMYRVVIDGSSNYYDCDLGEIYFRSPPNVTTSTVEVSYSIPGDFSCKGNIDGKSMYVGSFANIYTVADANSQDADGDGTIDCATCNDWGNDLNEIDVETSNTITYDLSDGDGTVYEYITIQCDGGNKYCKDVALDFDYDTSVPPEGDELSAFTAALNSGSDLGLPSSLLNYWKNQIPVVIGTLEGGTSAEYKFTLTYSESNITAGDDNWTLIVDDLGEYMGKDVELGTKATAKTLAHGYKS